MIEQGSDGLSRGLWFAPERRPTGINQLLFNPVPYSQNLGRWALKQAGWPERPWLHLDFRTETSLERIQGRITIWTPPPECARQVLVGFLQKWVQTPMDSGALFLVPRILQLQWGRVCRYVQEIGVFQSNLLPQPYCFDSHLPFVLLMVAPHRHHLRPKRMERPPATKPARWHTNQAEEVRRLS